MRIVEGDCFCPSHEIVEEASKIVASGGLVVAPTDTLYGIIADPFNEKAYRRVYKVKGRSFGKPLPLLLGESHHATMLVRADSLFWKLARAFWPGPLTIVAPVAPGVPEYLAPEGKVGVRLPDCPLVRLIARRNRGVVTGTSANKSGRENPVTMYNASEQLGDSIDLYIDGGPVLLGKPSTVVEIVEGKVEVLREGAIPTVKIEEALGYK